MNIIKNKNKNKYILKLLAIILLIPYTKSLFHSTKPNSTKKKIDK